MKIELDKNGWTVHARLPFASIEKRLLWRIMGRVKSFDGSALTI